MLARLLALQSFGIKLGLANIRTLCEALDHPERAFASLHVAGTNGKGSVTAMAHAALVAAGIRAARYTSPHLVDLRERFVIGSAPVGEADLESAATDVLDRADALVASGALAAPPTFFEATTAIAFELFRRAGIEAAVLEVGLGGRFDATNVVAPLATAIASVGMDHQQHLGSTLEQIAFEKAGIIKPGTAVVIGDLPGDAERVVRRVAADCGARVASASAGSTVESRVEDGRTTVTVTTPMHAYRPVTLTLRGEHQVQNALVAIRLLEEATRAGLAVGPDAIERGLAQAEWPGRLELLFFAGGRRLLLDAAHNPDGARSLAAYLERWHPARPPLVFAAMQDKDVAGMLGPLLPHVGSVIVTAPAMARAHGPEALGSAVRRIDPARIVAVEPDPVRAVDRAWEHGETACVAGSIFLVGAVRGALYPRAIVDSSP